MKTLAILLILMTVLSCKKDQIQYSVKGTVKNKITNAAVSQVKLTFFQTEVNNNALNPNFVYLGTTTTNSTGEYAFSFDRKTIDKFKILVEHDEYYVNETIYSSALLSTVDEVDFSYDLESKSWIEVRLKNNFVQANEYLNFHKYNVKEDCEACCVNGNLGVPFTIPDTTFICAVVGDVYFKYTYGESQANTSITDSILCTQFDTTSLYIEY